MRQLLVFIIALCLIGFYDFIWLSFIASNFYKTQFGVLGCATLAGVQGKWWAVIATYCLMALGFVIFVFPLLTANPSLSNPLHGALFGLVLFGGYQCTNYLVFRDWPLTLVFVDTAWGMFTYALTSCVTMGILRALTSYGLIK
jgi:uncharacterized membrane protein